MLIVISGILITDSYLKSERLKFFLNYLERVVQLVYSIKVHSELYCMINNLAELKQILEISKRRV